MSINQLNLLKYLLLFGLLFDCLFISQAFIFKNQNFSEEGQSQNFSPKMYYDEWTPLGQGNPLKNDPTFDYVPPVLDRVQYWLDSYSTEKSTKSDILAHDITTKKASLNSSAKILKLVDVSNININQDNSFQNSFTSSTRPESPKAVHTINVKKNIPSQNEHKIQPSNYVLNYYYNQKSRPYTALLPQPNNSKQKSNSIRKNILNPRNSEVKFLQLSTKISTQTEKGLLLHEIQKHNIDNKVHSQNSKLLSKLPEKLKHPGLLSEIETFQSHIQNSNWMYEATTSSASLTKSNLSYHSSRTLLEDWSKSDTSLTTLSLKKLVQSWNRSNINESLEDDQKLIGTSNKKMITEQKTNAIANEGNISNKHIIINQQERNDSLNSNALLKNLKKSNATDNNNSSAYTQLSTPSLSSLFDSNIMHSMTANLSITSNPSHKKNIKDIPGVKATTNNIPNSMQIDTPQFNTLTSSLTTIATPLENYLSPPLRFHQITKDHNLNSHPTTASVETYLPNFTSIYFTKNIHPSVPIKKMSIQTFPRKNSTLSIDKINISKKNNAVPLNASHVSYREFPKLQHDQKADFDQRNNVSYSKAMILLPVVTSVPSASLSAKVIDNKRPLTNDNDYKVKSHSPMITTILPATKFTNTVSLTTDPIFSHYKQPIQPINGPMYVIIEGHSKVKTYKPTMVRNSN